MQTKFDVGQVVFWNEKCAIRKGKVSRIRIDENKLIIYSIGWDIALSMDRLEDRICENIQEAIVTFENEDINGIIDEKL